MPRPWAANEFCRKSTCVFQQFYAAILLMFGAFLKIAYSKMKMTRFLLHF